MDRFVTLVLAVLDPTSHTLSLVNAGHPLPLLRRHGEANLIDAASLEAVGPFLGLDEGATYEHGHLALAPGDALILYTDGIPDAQSAGGVPFRVKGIHAALADAGPASPRQLAERIIEQVRQHAARVPQYDDMTLLCFGRLA
jgi:serine phosphatase RsbU (regulator of sigma subunit)